MASVLKSPDSLQLFRLSSQCLRRPRIRVPPPAFSTSRNVKATHTDTSSSNPSSTSGPKQNITVVDAAGRKRWTDLSVGGKAVRSTEQSFNFLVVIAGVVMTSAVGYVLYTEVFSTDSKTSHFNRATDQIRRDPRCTKLLGDGDKITAHGEPSWSRWARNRTLASTTSTDRYGTEHLHFKFYVEGPLNQGVVYVHMTKKPSQTEHEYHTLAVDIKGQQRIYLENVEDKKVGRMGPKMFGVRWW
ncbi:TIM21-domain-containing protein [Delitschia confertaspora ATCC 74209]|uniref:Mitochondrial import inner membrane translocase subunit Tim21 n=1 Tax=Delitschia confertaspora ATCC 74209 TaxID=1513339 RepID=A0A9P4MQ10_9PLEO|nr:TIM21-domain-containing protein [Delitschia confertaspora ATCC 74209]